MDGTQEHLARIAGANDQTLFWCLGMIFLVPLAKEPNRNARASDHCAAPVRIFYVGLGSVEQHIERVRRRVARGGHDIPEERIRVRYDNSRKNLVKLLPYLAELVAFDNTTEADPTAGQKPQPRKILRVKAARIEYVCPPDQVPDWCKPIVQAALRLERGRGG